MLVFTWYPEKFVEIIIIAENLEQARELFEKSASPTRAQKDIVKYEYPDEIEQAPTIRMIYYS